MPLRRRGDGRLALEGGARSVAGMTIGQGCNQGEPSPLCLALNLDFSILKHEKLRGKINGYSGTFGKGEAAEFFLHELAA